MKLLFSLLVALVLAAPSVASAQTNPRAHDAVGQDWVTGDAEPQVLNGCVSNVTRAVSNSVVISITNYVPATYAIWFSARPVTNGIPASLALHSCDAHAAMGLPGEPLGVRIALGATCPTKPPRLQDVAKDHCQRRLFV